MRIHQILLGIALFIGLVSFSLGVKAADGAVKVTSIAQVEIVVVDQDGKKTLRRIPVEKAVPGTEVIYTTTFDNLIDKAVGGIVINNPIPNDTEYKGGSAFGRDCDIVFSIDGGTTYGHAEELKVVEADGSKRTALPKEYTNIRWHFKGKLAAGKSGEVGFRSVIK